MWTKCNGFESSRRVEVSKAGWSGGNGLLDVGYGEVRCRGE